MPKFEVLSNEELETVAGGRDRKGGDAGYAEVVNKYQLNVGENYYFVFHEGFIEGLKYLGGETKYLYGTCLWTGERKNPFLPEKSNKTIRYHEVRSIMGYFSNSRTKKLYINGDRCTVYKKGPEKL